MIEIKNEAWACKVYVLLFQSFLCGTLRSIAKDRKFSYTGLGSSDISRITFSIWNLIELSWPVQYMDVAGKWNENGSSFTKYGTGWYLECPILGLRCIRYIFCFESFINRTFKRPFVHTYRFHDMRDLKKTIKKGAKERGLFLQKPVTRNNESEQDILQKLYGNELTHYYK